MLWHLNMYMDIVTNLCQINFISIGYYTWVCPFFKLYFHLHCDFRFRFSYPLYFVKYIGSFYIL
jgi:hypothetical protein